MLNEQNAKKLKTISKIILSVLTLVVGFLFLQQVLTIYFTGKGTDTIYSREIVSAKLLEILVPVIIWVLAIIFTAVVWGMYPDGKIPHRRDEVYVLNKLKKRLPAVAKEGLLEEYNFIKDQTKKVKTVKIISFVLTALFVVYFLVYMFLPSSFTDKTYATQEIIKMLTFILPALAIIFAMNVFCKYYELESAKKQMPAVKKLIVGEKEEKAQSTKSELVIKIVRLTLLAVGVLFVIAGIFNGSMRDVLIKAINICTECIGLG